MINYEGIFMAVACSGGIIGNVMAHATWLQ